MLTKTVTVMTSVDPDYPMSFDSWREGGDRDHVLVLDPDVWEDFGYPTTITVTIEPGDKLNGEQ